MAAQIIQFPVQHSNGYNNLIQLFEICDSLESCNFYLESVEQLFQKGYISEKEMYTLRRIGRGKRLELTQPEKQESQEATEPGVYQYTPEMGGAKPDCQMEASRGYYGGHWFIDTPLEIKGRGITFLKKYTDKDFCTPGHYRVGWNEYRVTNKAFDKLKRTVHNFTGSLPRLRGRYRMEGGQKREPEKDARIRRKRKRREIHSG